jgi:hypothetical protein
MSTQIKDGEGGGSLAGVTRDHRLKSEAKAIPELTLVSSEQERAFYTFTDFITLATSGVFSGVYFLRNGSQNRYCLHQLRTSNSMVARWKMIKNPTTGTLITAGTPKEAENLDSGSPIQFGSVPLAGADSQTVTDGKLWDQWINQPGHTTEQFSGAIIIQPGDSMALVCDPVAAGDVSCSLLWTTVEGS